MTGEWPENMIDHKNTIRYDDRWENLREANNSQNANNSPARSNSKLGVKGVSISKNKYKAQIRIGSRYTNLGIFNTLEEAKEAYNNAAKVQHGDFIHESLK